MSINVLAARPARGGPLPLLLRLPRVTGPVGPSILLGVVPLGRLLVARLLGRLRGRLVLGEHNAQSGVDGFHRVHRAAAAARHARRVGHRYLLAELLLQELGRLLNDLRAELSRLDLLRRDAVRQLVPGEVLVGLFEAPLQAPLQARRVRRRACRAAAVAARPRGRAYKLNVRINTNRTNTNSAARTTDAR